MNDYKQGFIDAMSCYAVSKNGTQVIGVAERLLKDEVADVEHNQFYNPPRPGMILTLELIDMLPANKVFACGVSVGIDVMNPIGFYKWVAITGRADDWTIYYGRIEEAIDAIAQVGDKLCNNDIIRRIMPCADEALERYRE